MKSSFILFAMITSVFGISVARAQETIDVAKITCDQFVVGDVSDSHTISIWLSGFYDGTHHNTVVDVSAAKQHESDLFNYCSESAHRKMTLMEAVENALGAKK